MNLIRPFVQRIAARSTHQQGRVIRLENTLKVEREHSKKNRTDLKAYKVNIIERVNASEKAERRVKEHLRIMR